MTATQSLIYYTAKKIQDYRGTDFVQIFSHANLINPTFQQLTEIKELFDKGILEERIYGKSKTAKRWVFAIDLKN